MNKKQLLFSILILFFVCGCSLAQRQSVKDQQPVMVADQKYYWESEGNLGISITGKFNSPEQMMEALSLAKEIGTFKSTKWKLCDILVSMDLNANGDVATWEVSGPKPLLLDYIEQLKAGNDEQGGHLFYDFGYYFINFQPTAYWEDGWRQENE